MSEPVGERRVVLLAGAFEPAAESVARAILAAGGCVAAAVANQDEAQKLRMRLAHDDLLVGAVGARDGTAAATFVRAATDALGAINEFYGGSCVLRAQVAGGEPAEDLAELVEINVHRNVTLARAVLPGMRQRQRGTLQFINISVDPDELSATCRASLAALREFAVALQHDLDGSGVEVVVREPQRIER